ncbi:MAG: hypothetical protein U9P50_00050 [Patescibacteria group bacterium]|nr:hypothetical protein [Patescibacteria group bacterium]
MAKKKVKKRKRKLSKSEKEELDTEGELPKKSVKKNETRQLIWFFVVVAVVFASFLIPYFYLQSLKSFEYAGVDWMREDYGQFEVYHSEFPALNGENYKYNIFLRNDPRENNVSADGNFRDFKIGGFVSISPEVDLCRGDVSRVMLDLGSFLELGLGIQKVWAATPSFEVHNQTGRAYATCNTRDRTVIMVEIGEPAVVQSKTNPFCYTIRVRDCEDIEPVEKFMIEVIWEFREN